MQVATSKLDDGLETDFHQTLNTIGGFEPAAHVAVAVSGGADSMALCLLADRWTKTHKGRVTALIIDHGLRQESASEAAQTQAWLHAREIDSHVITVTVPDQKNLQNAARDVRYTALLNWCHQHHVLHLLLGHHQGDQVETIALHTARGTTADGSSGMAIASLRQGVRLIRPLLAIQKPVLEHYLRMHAQPWVHDPSNDNSQFARVKIRKELQEHPAQYHALLKQLSEQAPLRQAREAQIANDAANGFSVYPEGYGILQRNHWQALPPTRAMAVLASVIRCLGGHINRARGHEIERLYHTLTDSDAGFNKATLGGLLLQTTASKEAILLTREINRMPATNIHQPNGKLLYDQRFMIEWRGLDALLENAELQIKPLGYQGFKATISSQMDQLGTPKAALICAPALWHLDLPVWIPHIGFMNKAFSKTSSFNMQFMPRKPLAEQGVWWLNGAAKKTG